MSIIENRTTYLFTELSAPYSFPVVFSMIEQVAKICQDANLNKVLADARAFTEHISTFDRYRIGVEIAKVFGSHTQIAIVLRPSEITYVGENTAINRRAKLKVFSIIEEAQQWLGISESTTG